MCPQADNGEDDGQCMANYLSLWVSSMFLVCFMYTSYSKLIQLGTLAQSLLSIVAAGDASQTTPVQITHVFMLCYSTQIVHVATILIPVRILLNMVCD